MKLLYIALLGTALSLSGCGSSENETSAKTAKAAPPPIPAEFENGKMLWSKNCQVCHLNGLGGAPKLQDKKAWTARIAKGEEMLIRHAINGFTGSDGIMPPKGGATQLTDDEIAEIVRFMMYMGK